MLHSLNTALTALYADRLSLETIGNNIANVNTEGYSRQSVQLSPINSSPAAFWSVGTGVGQGVTVESISRMRDVFMEARSYTEHSSQGQLEQSAKTYEAIQTAFGEPGDNGLQAQMAEFWASWDDLTNNPGDLAARSQVTESAKTLTSGFQQADATLTSLRTSSTSELIGVVSQVNAMARSIADLNGNIRNAVNAGASPNAMLDQRDRLVSQMSDLVGVTVQQTNGGSVAVLVGGIAIVRDDRVNTLKVDNNSTPLTLSWDVDGDLNTTVDSFNASVSGGKVGGLLEGINTTLPKYRDLLNTVASQLITSVNSAHTAGVDQDGNAGVPFFTGTSATTIDVSAAVGTNPRLVAAAAAGGGELDGENARAIAEFANAVSGADASYRQLVDVLGVEGQRANRRIEIQAGITQAVDASRDSVAGVNLDEEMTNLVRFQHSYNAAARYLSVVDGLLETLIAMAR